MIIDRFLGQVEKQPLKVAIKNEAGETTYRQLDRLSDRLAERVGDVVKGETRVGLLLSDSAQMIAAMLACLKAGQTYVPLVKEVPLNRFQYIVDHAGIGLFITDAANREKVRAAAQSPDTVIITLEDLPVDGGSRELTPARRQRRDENAYILYTSGSTGFPKGVVQTHAHILYFIDQYIHHLGLKAGDRLTLFSSFCHDASIVDIYAALLSGATLFPLDLKKENVFSLLPDWLKADQITVWHSVPTVYRYFVAGLAGKPDLPDLRYIVLGGEAVQPSDVEKFPALFPHCRLYNLYGQTESTYNSGQWFSGQDQGQDLTITLGEPNEGISLFVVDEEGREGDALEVGEILVSSPFISPGYWKDETASAEKFQADPQAGRIYFTGDRGRRLTDGRIEFLGRLDGQVKVRGYRVELAEIENVMLQYEGMTAVAVVAVQTQSGEPLIAAYFTARLNVDLNIDRLVRFLSDRLMDYMIPAYLKQLVKMPLTMSGKIDRQALPKPEIFLRSGYVAPANELEKKLARIWSEILGIGEELIGVDNSFFDLGGHSLSATLLTARIFRDLAVRVRLSEVFAQPTIRALAQTIASRDRERFENLEPVEKRDYYPVIASQRQLYFLQRLEPLGTAYNLIGAFNLETTANREQLERSFYRLIDRLEILRTFFEMKDTEVVQRVADRVDFHLEYFEIEVGSGDSAADMEVKKLEVMKRFIRPFDLGRPPLFRAGLLRMGDKYMLFFDVHHIVSDNRSLILMEWDFLRFYDGADPVPLPLQFKDYCCWLNTEGQKDYLERQIAYWQEVLKGELPALDLPYDYPRPALQGIQGDTYIFVMEENGTYALKEVGLKRQATLFMVLLSIFKLLLWRLSGQEDILVGVPLDSRIQADVQGMPGMFVNTVVLRTDIGKPATFGDLLADIKQSAVQAHENLEYPYDVLLERLAVRRDGGRNPLFDVMFNQLEERAFKGDTRVKCDHDTYQEIRGTSRFDLTLSLIDRGPNLVGRVEYSTHLFKRQTIERLVAYFLRLADGVCRDPDLVLREIEIMDEAEKKRILDMSWGGEDVGLADVTLSERFYRQVQASADRAALCGPDMDGESVQLTYMELAGRVDGLAGELKSRGVGQGSIVAIMMPRQVDTVIGILAVLAAGGAYLPIDPDYPQERNDYMLADSGAEIVISPQTVGANCCSPIQDIGAECKGERQFAPTDLAYVIYTSGSTGRPKGVPVNQQSVINILGALQGLYPFSPGDTYLLKTSILFDVSVPELFGWFMGGGRLAVLAAGSEKDPLLILEAIERHRVTHINFVPSMFQVFLETLEKENKRKMNSLRYFFLAGEALAGSLVKRFNALGLRAILENLYGPTEATVYASRYAVSEWPGEGGVPIGRPLANMGMYVLDQYRRLQPLGVKGEIYIGGQGLSRGYLNNPGLTAEKFVGGLYKTGDVARWLEDGSIEFLGRLDFQVKIRGFRIELQEIEHRLCVYEPVKEAVVMAKSDGGGDHVLCAYLVWKGDAQVQPDTGKLREFLAKTLPAYMIPSYFVPLGKFPLTPTGKIDLKALPDPRTGLQDKGTDPLGSLSGWLEVRLADLWAEVLGIERGLIGRQSHFFDLGGHSLRAVILAGRIHRQFDVRLPVGDIFQVPTLMAMAGRLQVAEKEAFSSLQSTEKCDHYPVSGLQKRLFILDAMQGISTAYHLVDVILISGELCKDRLQDAWAVVIQRHESLRTSFLLVQDEVRQRVHERVDFELEVLRVGGRGGQEQIETIIQGFVRPFDLGKAPLLRVALIESSPGNYALVHEIHHIVADGTSIEILRQNLFKAYLGLEMPVTNVHYRDFVCWQNSGPRQELLKRQEDFWLGRFPGEISKLHFPTDFKRPELQSFSGDMISLTLESGQVAPVYRLARSHGVTLYMLLLAVYNVLLMKYSGQQDIVVGTPTAGRDHADLENLVGLLINVLPMRNFPIPDKPFSLFLDEVKENTLRAYENQDYSIGDLIERLGLVNSISRNPLFDVELVVQNMDVRVPAVPGLNIRTYDYESHNSQVDFSLYVSEAGGSIQLDMVFCSDLFKKETMNRFMMGFLDVIFTVAKNPDIRLVDIQLAHGLAQARTDSYEDIEGDFDF